MNVIQDKLNVMDKVLDKSAEDDPVTRRLMTVPGVGPVTAVAFRATIDDPKSFKKSRDVGGRMWGSLRDDISQGR